MLTTPEYLLTLVIVAVGAMVQGAVGMGGGMLTVPLLTLIEPRLVPGSPLFSSLALTVLVLQRERRSVDFFGVKWGITGRILGTILATGLLTRLLAEQTNVVIGGLVLFGVLLSVSGLSVQRTMATLLGAGVLSGIMGTLSSVGGPPMALLYQDAEGPQVRATLAGFFILGTTISLGALVVVGHFGWIEFLASLSLLPGVLLGYVLSGTVKMWLDKGFLRPAILVLCTTSALITIVKHL